MRMTFIEKVHLLERMDQLIRLKSTGTPTELAEKLNVSRSTIYEIIDCLKFLGAEIDYSRTKRSFCYSCNMKFKIGFSHEKQTSHE